MKTDKVLAEIVARVDAGAVAERMLELFRAHIAAYRRLPGEVQEEIRAVSRRNVELFFATLVEGRPLGEDELEPFRASARRRAADGLPLEDVLHAYRVGGRLGWEALVEAATLPEQAALLPGVAQLLEYVDRVSDAVTEAYHDERLHLMSEEERRLFDLLHALGRDGDLPPRLRALADGIGLPLAPEYMPFGLSVPGAAANARARMAGELRSRGVLAVTEGSAVVGLIPPAGDTAPHVAGGALRVVGEPTLRAELPEALDEVRLALELGVRLGRSGELRPDALLPELLLARSPRLGSRLAQRALGPLERIPGRRNADLLGTLEVFVAVGLARRRAAERLHVHPNTLDYRLRRIEELTGLSFSRPDDLLVVTLALKQRALEPAVGADL